MERDRLKGAFAGLVHGSDPTSLYERIWRAKVVSQSADLLKVGVVPVDPRLPPMDHVPLRHGVPGLTVKVAAGAFLRVGWDDGNPTEPFAALWDGASSRGAANARGAGANGGAVERVVISSALLELGGIDLTQQAMLGTIYVNDENALLDIISAWMDGVTAAINGNPLTPPPLKVILTGLTAGTKAAISAFKLAPHLSSTVTVK